MDDLKLEKIQVSNFRNLKNEIIEFGPNINCILGDNGNGKTNILEAVYVLATRRSFRKNASFPQFLGMDGEKPEIIFSSVINDGKRSISYSGKIETLGSNWFLDGRPAKKKPDLSAIFLNPFDSYAFHNTPSFRRNWFDGHLSLLNREYKKVLNQYNQALRFRNTLLAKRPSHYLEQIGAIDIDFAKYSTFLTRERVRFLEDLRPFCAQTFQEIFCSQHEIDFQLDGRYINLSPEAVVLKLQERLQIDLNAGRTTYGVHKDDYVLLFDGLNSFEYCSLGQQKMSYLSLVFAYIELFRYKFRSFPMVLIDDVSGELDKHRWKKLVEYLRKREFQVFITTANEKFREELEQIAGARRLYVEAGSVELTQLH